MKRILALTAALSLTLCGCSGAQGGNPSGGMPEGAEPFENIMGLKGYVVNVSEADSDWYERVYHAELDGKDVIIGESFGYGEPQDFVADLYEDGVSELICNCTFGGDGAQRVYTYQLVDGQIQVGTIALEDWTEGYTGPESAVAELYLPEDECYFVACPDGNGGTVDSYFSVDELVWNAFEPTHK
jgi:hypothetical protein